MGIKRYLLKEQRFYLAKISGTLTDNVLEQHVLTVNEETAGIHGLRQLTDCSEVTDVTELTVSGTTLCAKKEIIKPESLLAIIVPEGAVYFGMARAYSIFAEDSRKEVRIFRDVNEALEWLVPEPSELLSVKEFMKSV